MSAKSGLFVLSVLSVILFALFLTGCCRTVDVQYTEKEEYSVQVPYQEQEAYTDKLKYTIVSKEMVGVPGVNYVKKGYVKVRNDDIETGDFTVEQSFLTLNDPIQTLRTTKRILAGETLEFVETYDSDLSEDVKYTINVIPSSITKFRMISKTRTETRTRDVNKTRQEQNCSSW